MRDVVRILTVLLLACGITVLAQDKKAPEKLVFESKMGNVTFNHAGHVARAKGDCKACHDKLFEQSAKAPLNFKAAMHKTAETAQTSCGSCHHAGGTAFESKGNCNKCHVKA
ncbi:MAG TPA: c(7)-type cytochrome triheme domain-containing protein [Bryobacteraceae bacterium]|jgi:c(7)-type cytochrome triheme protein|nr:c(7)-type cytochrome triheme domain-containing protein [Bryobacteraceae bacterium]